MHRACIYSSDTATQRIPKLHMLTSHTVLAPSTAPAAGAQAATNPAPHFTAGIALSALIFAFSTILVDLLLRTNVSSQSIVHIAVSPGAFESSTQSASVLIAVGAVLCAARVIAHWRYSAGDKQALQEYGGLALAALMLCVGHVYIAVVNVVQPSTVWLDARAILPQIGMLSCWIQIQGVGTLPWLVRPQQQGGVAKVQRLGEAVAVYVGCAVLPTLCCIVHWHWAMLIVAMGCALPLIRVTPARTLASRTASSSLPSMVACSTPQARPRVHVAPLSPPRGWAAQEDTSTCGMPRPSRCWRACLWLYDVRIFLVQLAVVALGITALRVDSAAGQAIGWQLGLWLAVCATVLNQSCLPGQVLSVVSTPMQSGFSPFPEHSTHADSREMSSVAAPDADRLVRFLAHEARVPAQLAALTLENLEFQLRRLMQMLPSASDSSSHDGSPHTDESSGARSGGMDFPTAMPAPTNSREPAHSSSSAGVAPPELPASGTHETSMPSSAVVTGSFDSRPEMPQQSPCELMASTRSCRPSATTQWNRNSAVGLLTDLINEADATKTAMDHLNDVLTAVLNQQRQLAERRRESPRSVSAMTHLLDPATYASPTGSAAGPRFASTRTRAMSHPPSSVRANFNASHAAVGLPRSSSETSEFDALSCMHSVLQLCRASLRLDGGNIQFRFTSGAAAAANLLSNSHSPHAVARVARAEDAGLSGMLSLSTSLRKGLHMQGSATSMRQVLLNLVRNAQKYGLQADPQVPPHRRFGTIEVELRIVDTSQLGTSSLPDTAPEDALWLQTIVRDYGRGMRADEVTSLFHEFKQLRKDDAAVGSGLGLSFCHQWLAENGGELQGSSAGPGQGSHFTATMPLRLVSMNGALAASLESALQRVEVGRTASNALVLPHGSSDLSEPEVRRIGSAPGTLILPHVRRSMCASVSSGFISPVVSVGSHRQLSHCSRHTTSPCTSGGTESTRASRLEARPSYNSSYGMRASEVEVIDEERPEFTSLVIAIVDDERPIRVALARSLQRQPLVERVLAYENGELAVPAVLREQPDIVLLDSHLGHGAHGMGVTEALRAGGFCNCILGLTGDQDSITEFYAAGANGVLIKGLSGQELYQRILEALTAADYTDL